MRKRFLRRPSAALVVALIIALFVALGGTSYAAIKLPRNSVGTAQIKNRAVTQTKIAKKTLAALHGRRGATGPQGPVGPTGQTGQAGVQGVQGPAGPVNLTYATVQDTALRGMSETADATCPAGMVVTGGGVFPVTSVPGNEVSVGESDWVTSTASGPPDTWEGTLDNFSTTTDVTFLVDAICTKPTNISSAAPKAAKAFR
jgi:hypothetical protein